MTTRCKVDFTEHDISEHLKHHHAVAEIAAILEDHKRADRKFASQNEADKFFHSGCRELEKIPDWLLFDLLATLEKLPEPKTILLGNG